MQPRIDTDDAVNASEVAPVFTRSILLAMTRDVLETAVREGIPFLIRVADGEKYEVTARDRIIIGTTRIALMDERDVPHVLPLLTMTGVSFLPDGNAAS